MARQDLSLSSEIFWIGFEREKWRCLHKHCFKIV